MKCLQVILMVLVSINFTIANAEEDCTNQSFAIKKKIFKHYVASKEGENYIKNPSEITENSHECLHKAFLTDKIACEYRYKNVPEDQVSTAEFKDNYLANMLTIYNPMYGFACDSPANAKCTLICSNADCSKFRIKQDDSPVVEIFGEGEVRYQYLDCQVN